ncbi:MAG: hypothetical protein K8S25_11340 [Alphaproteobacteria bacterium]|nr:hypothetical protein [Alphaproteobacteria bacterium]
MISAPTSILPPAFDAMPQPSVKREGDGFGFDDFLDVINPLQHLPLIGTLYREATGDEIQAPARLAGGALFGGLFGFLGTLGTIAFEGLTGESVDETITSLFDAKGSGDDPFRAQRAYASAQALGGNATPL